MSESATRQQVWLIKAPPSGENEAYTDELLHAGFQPKYIPAIIERYETAELEDLLAQKDTKWDGVVITSRRGVEGWIRAAKAVVGQHSAECQDFNEIPLYTVGYTSISALSDSKLPSVMLPDVSNAISAKSAVLLGQKMLHLLPPPQAGRSFLFIRGDKSSNDLQPMLREAGYSVKETQVYVTSANPKVEAYISEAINTLPTNSSSLWLVFFSPSTSGYALPHLQSLMASERAVQIAAIGEKTRSFLVENGIKVDAVAEEPNAAGLVQALQRAARDQ